MIFNGSWPLLCILKSRGSGGSALFCWLLPCETTSFPISTGATLNICPASLIHASKYGN